MLFNLKYRKFDYTSLFLRSSALPFSKRRYYSKVNFHKRQLNEKKSRPADYIEKTQKLLITSYKSARSLLRQEGRAARL